MVNGIKHYRLKLKQTGEKEWSQKAVADHAGIPRSRLSMIENGHMLPTVEELEKIAEYLGVSPGHLYTPNQIQIIHEMDRGRMGNA